MLRRGGKYSHGRALRFLGALVLYAVANIVEGHRYRIGNAKREKALLDKLLGNLFKPGQGFLAGTFIIGPLGSLRSCGGKLAAVRSSLTRLLQGPNDIVEFRSRFMTRTGEPRGKEPLAILG